jgi:1-aminocyclopropane-1-carboxylate deaminase/D-cysteine desulfhydrase-like pyridoxal-dependent ACC family enzyme
MNTLLKKIQVTTVVMMVAALIVLLAYDIFAAVTAGTNATISWMLWTLSHKWPIIPFSVGFLCGHLFFSQVDANDAASGHQG